jgi:hypothetical protein
MAGQNCLPFLFSEVNPIAGRLLLSRAYFLFRLLAKYINYFLKKHQLFFAPLPELI